MGRLRLRLAIVALSVLACGTVTAGTEVLPDRIEQHDDGKYSLIARGAAFGDLADALARAADCRCRVEEKLRARPLELDLSPRSPERLAHALARAADARLAVSYRLEPVSSGRPARPGRGIFAQALVQPEGPMPKPIQDAVVDLGVPVDVAEEVRGKVRLSLRPRPLGAVLDALARQTRSRWVTVLSFEARTPSRDPDAAETDRMHEHLDHLAQLPAEDRRIEIAEEIHRLERLPVPERSAAIGRLAKDIVSLGTLLQRVPGEHRLIVGAQVLPVARDYAHVLSDLRPGKQQLFQPLFDALGQLDLGLRRLR